MSEESLEEADGVQQRRWSLPPAPEPTGVSAVDEVVASVAGLPGTALAEHVAVFEQAHARLRRALDEPSGPRPPVG
ncbi:hypothetical protein [Nocardioides sp.]|uniref:hypothetical protein n=1 Tax=Nocardioides sp. TaxID=35761 RepID=UPI00351550D5